MPELKLYSPPAARSPRLDRVLAAGLAGLPHSVLTAPAERRPGTRLLPAFSLPPDGLCPELLSLLSALRRDFQLPYYQGLLQKARGDRSAAWETWNAMVANDPENWLVYLCRADCHAREADYPAAIADYRQAAALQPKPRYTDPWDSVAQLSRLSQDRESEAEAYERIIDILQTDWGLGECETVQGYRENLKACR